MKKYALAFSLILLAAWLGLASPNYQSNPSAQKGTKAISGAVVSVGASTNEVVIKDDAGNEVHLMVSQSTKITRDGKAIALADVKTGERVAGECAPASDGRCLATTIMITSKQPSQ